VSCDSAIGVRSAEKVTRVISKAMNHGKKCSFTHNQLILRTAHITFVLYVCSSVMQCGDLNGGIANEHSPQ